MRHLSRCTGLGELILIKWRFGELILIKWRLGEFISIRWRLGRRRTRATRRHYRRSASRCAVTGGCVAVGASCSQRDRKCHLCRRYYGLQQEEVAHAQGASRSPHDGTGTKGIVRDGARARVTCKDTDRWSSLLSSLRVIPLRPVGIRDTGFQAHPCGQSCVEL